MDEATREILGLEYTAEQIDAIDAFNAKLLLGKSGWTQEQIDNALNETVDSILNKYPIMPQQVTKMTNLEIVDRAMKSGNTSIGQLVRATGLSRDTVRKHRNTLGVLHGNG